MRLSSLAALTFVLIVVPMTTQAAEKAVFGNYTCRESVPCDAYGNFSSEQWAKAGASCLTSGFGFAGMENIFDSSAGLDSSNCLSTNSGSGSKGAQGLVPSCCVVELSPGKCVLSCKITQ